MDAHLPSVEGVGTFTARGLADHQAKDLGWHADWAGNLKVLFQSLVLQVSANLFQSLDLSGGQGDADAVDWGFFGGFGL